MEPYLVDLINNNKVPKIIRYILVIILISFITYICINVGLHAINVLGNIFGFLIAILSLITGVILLIKIYKS